MLELIKKIDEKLFRIINSSGSISYDNFMIFISEKTVWIPLYLLILFFLFRKYNKSLIKIIISIVALIFIADFGSVKLFKEVFERQRPCHFLENVRVVNGCGGAYGFVSSHAANTFAIAFYIFYMLRKKIFLIFLFSWASLIGISRIYLGVHYPLDIIGGIIWGYIASFIVYFCLKRFSSETI